MILDEHEQTVKRPATRRQIGLLKALYTHLGFPNEYQGQELSFRDASRLIDDAQRRLDLHERTITPTPPSGLTLEQEIKDLFN